MSEGFCNGCPNRVENLEFRTENSRIRIESDSLVFREKPSHCGFSTERVRGQKLANLLDNASECEEPIIFEDLSGSLAGIKSLFGMNPEKRECPAILRSYVDEPGPKWQTESRAS